MTTTERLVSTRQLVPKDPRVAMRCAAAGILLWATAWLPIAGAGAPARARSTTVASPATMPAALQLAATRSMARDADSEYHIGTDGHGVNPRHGFELRFTPEGALIDRDGRGFTLHLARFGRNEGEPVRHVPPRIDGAWVEYERGRGLSEWFVNLPRGVEQGWTIAARPPGTGGLVLELHTGRPPDRQGAERMAWSGVLYHGLVAVDATGQVLSSRWTHKGDRLRIEVDDQEASYPIVIDPWVEEAKLVASASGSFSRVALSGDTALVGAWNATVEGNLSQGLAYIFVRSNGSWVEQAKLTASDGGFFYSFGIGVALAGDTALVGALNDIAGGVGTAYVFTRDGDTWSEQAKLHPPDGAPFDEFGQTVALYGDTALVGTPYAPVGGNTDQGAVYVFTREGDIWNQQAKLTASDGAPHDNFSQGGTSVGVALYENTALVVAPRADVNGNIDQGAAYVFTREGDTWSEQAKLIPSDGATGRFFGQTVTLWGDTALVGRTDTTSEDGAYVFVRDGDTWSEQAKLTPSDVGPGDNIAFGHAIALQENTAVIGAPDAEVAYVFRRNGDTWSEETQLTASDAGGDHDLFGFSVALSGATAVAAAASVNPGAAYVFTDFVLPPDFGTIEGTVRSLGYCSEGLAPLEGAVVEILGTEDSYLLESDESGFYQIHLPDSESPLEITVTTPGHLPVEVQGIVFSGGDVVINDFDLVLDAPCTTANPPSLSIQLAPDESTAETLTLGNVDGVAEVTWSVDTAEQPVRGDATQHLYPDRPAEVREDTEADHVDADVTDAVEVVDLASVLGGPLPGPRPVGLVGGAMDCDAEPGLIVHDDGTIENGYAVDPATVNEVAFVDQFTPIAYPATFRSLCVAFITVSGGPTSLDFEVVVFDDDGPGGSPGTELGTKLVSADDIPVVVPPIPPDFAPTWFSYDISSLGITIDSGSAYIGVRWAATDPPVYLTADHSSGNPVGYAGGYFWTDTVGTWRLIQNSFPLYRSMFLRAVASLGGCETPSMVPWLSATPEAGSTPAGGTTSIEVTADAAGLQGGEYVASLCITTNDSHSPLLVVPVHLTILGSELVFDPSSLDFGDVEAGTTSLPQTVMLHNVGPLDATGLNFQILGDGFDADTSDCSTTLPAEGGQCLVSITFTPPAPGPAEAALEANSDDGALAAVSLSGTGATETEAFIPIGLDVDPEPIISDANGIFEPGELAMVAPAWQNGGMFAQILEGTASNLTGPEGPTYSLLAPNADYGEVEPGQVSSCQATELCYEMDIGPAGVPRPAPHWDAAFDETLSDETTHTWSLHLGDSFLDVPRASPFYSAIETLLHSGVTGGCTDSEYCPTGPNTRAQMPVFVLKALEGADYMPPACETDTQVFADVPHTSPFCPWIEELANRNLIAGCGGDNYCPNDPVTRAQMAVFLLKTFEEDGYTPPECTGEFTDVTCPSLFAAWIEELSDRGVTGGCSADPPAYCPAAPVTRQQMAVFVTKTFGLELYGP